MKSTKGVRACGGLEGWIDESLVNAKIAENEYKEKRQAEYPSIEDQLDDLYHNGIDGWKATIKAVKDKYPKE